MRLYYTSHLRKYDMGVLQLGISVFPIHFIPPGAEAFLSYGLCKTEKFEEVKLGDVPLLRFLALQQSSGLIPKLPILSHRLKEWLKPGAQKSDKHKLCKKGTSQGFRGNKDRTAQWKYQGEGEHLEKGGQSIVSGKGAGNAVSGHGRTNAVMDSEQQWLPARANSR